MKPLQPLLAAGAAVATALLLAACGGSDGDDTPAEDPTLVPSSATSSVAAFMKFTGALMSSETAEALLLTGVSALPTSDTDEPMPLAQ
jgi:hypothetical protein